MLTFINACISASLGDKGLFSTANILQAADVIHQVDNLLTLPAMFLANSLPISSS